MTLRKKTFSAVRWTTAAAVARATLQLAQITVLARLLTPEDFGLMAMVGVALTFTGLFADLGLNSAYVHRQDVSPEQRSSLYWLNIGMSAVLSLLLILLSPLLAHFFGDERLTPMLMLSATTLAINAAGQQLKLNAEKELNFRPVVMLEISAAALGFVTAGISAYYGAGAYSLVYGSVVTALVGTLLAWTMIANGWRPLWQFSIDDVKPYLGFGGSMVANGIFNNINLSMDLLLGGRLLAATQLGLYSVPRNLILQIQFLVNPIITRVGFPLIAKVQDDIPRVRAIYLKTLNMTASINAPLYIGIAFFSPEIVQILLGDNWSAAAEFMRVLAIWGLLRSIGNPVGSLLMGVGRADLEMKWNFGLLFIVPVFLWVGSHFGALGLAWSLLLFSIFIIIPGWYLLVRPTCQAGLIDYLVTAFKPMFIALIAITLAFASVDVIEHQLLRLIAGVVISALLYLLLSYKGNSEWVDAMLELAGRKNTAPD